MSKNRNILLVAFARFISRLGGVAVFFIGNQGKAAYLFECTPRQLATMMLGASLASIAGAIVSGVLVDRFGPRKVMIVAEVLTIPAVLILASLDTFRPFAVMVAVFSAVTVPTFTASASFAPYLVEGTSDLERVNSMVEGAGAVAFVLGPAMGSLVGTAFGINAVYYVMAVGSLLAAWAAWQVRIDETPRVARQGNALAEFTRGLKIAYSTRSLRYFILTGTVVWVGFGAFSALEPLFYRDVVGVGLVWIGWMNTGFGLGEVAGAFLFGRLPKRFVNARTLATAAVLMGLGALAYVGTTLLPVIAVGALSWGLIIGFFEPLMRTLVHVASPREYVGRVVGTMQYHKNAGELVPLALAPSLAVIIGVQPTLIVGGLIVGAVGLLSLPIAKAVDREMAEVRAMRPLPDEPALDAA